MTEEKVYNLAKDRILYLISENEEKYLEEFTMFEQLPIERIFKLAYDELKFLLQNHIEKHLDSVAECVSEEIEELKELAINKGLQL